MSQFPEMGQPGQPAPFATMPGYPQPRKSRWWLWLLLGIGGVGVAICCGCAGLTYFGLSAAGTAFEGPMLSKLNADPTVQEKLGTVTSAKWDMMASTKAVEKSKSQKPIFVFHVVGDKGSGDVHADQAVGEKMFENARLIIGEETFPLNF